MPYIKQKDRDKLDEAINNLVFAVTGTLNEGNENLDGILNYCFFRICNHLYPKKYHWLNRMMGMMECCKLELYRRLVAPYEDEKIISNGDVL